MDYNKLEGIEWRHRFGGEVRSIEERDDDIVLEAMAAVFNQWTELGDLRERIAPGAFENALPTSDVRFLVNHDGLPLARTTSGTLKLAETEEGLFMRALLARRDPDVRALVPKIERGDLNQFSFAFRVAPEGQKWEGRDRTITEFAEIYDTSIVTAPAYEEAKLIALRSLELHARGVVETDVAESRLRRALIGR